MARTDKERADFLNEHVWYEIDMLAAAGSRIHDDGEADETVRNVFIEATASHARCLHDFLSNIGTKPADDAYAKEFTSPAFTAAWGADAAALKTRTNKEIAHLTWSRKGPGDPTKDWPRKLVDDVLRQAEVFWTEAKKAVPGVVDFPPRASAFLLGPPLTTAGMVSASTASVNPPGPFITTTGIAGIGTTKP